MSYTDTMSPKLLAIRKRLPKFIKRLNRVNAQAILAASQPLVPVDTGALKSSGRVRAARQGDTVLNVTTDRSDPRGIKSQKGGSVVIYGGGGFTNPRTGRAVDYAGVVHYRQDVKHRGVGQAQYVGQPLRTERPARENATARAMRRWLKGF